MRRPLGLQPLLIITRGITRALVVALIPRVVAPPDPRLIRRRIRQQRLTHKATLPGVSKAAAA
jgi:hypothetical protein